MDRKRPERHSKRISRFDEQKELYHDLVEKILEGIDSPDDQFRRILEARGFLLETASGRISLSDNSSFEDFRSLDMMLREYNLGHFSCKEENISGEKWNRDIEMWVYRKE